jgi:hypothetical protein
LDRGKKKSHALDSRGRLRPTPCLLLCLSIWPSPLAGCYLLEETKKIREISVIKYTLVPTN